MNESARFVRMYSGAAESSIFWFTPDMPQSRVFRYLGSERSLVFLRAQTLHTSGPPPDMRAIARFYADSVAAAGVHGAVVLAGYCIAAAVAREVAIELQARGVAIGALIMIDPPDPAESRASVLPVPLNHRVLTGLRRILMHLGRLQHLSLRQKADYIRGSAHGVWMRVNYQRSRRAQEEAIVTGQPTATEFRSNYLTSVAAFMNSVPQKYKGRIHVIRPNDVPKGTHEYPNRRWQQLTEGEVVIVRVPGNSSTMWQEPAVADLARAVKQCIGG